MIDFTLLRNFSAKLKANSLEMDLRPAEVPKQQQWMCSRIKLHKRGRSGHQEALLHQYEPFTPTG